MANRNSKCEQFIGNPLRLLKIGIIPFLFFLFYFPLNYLLIFSVGATAYVHNNFYLIITSWFNVIEDVKSGNFFNAIIDNFFLPILYMIMILHYTQIVNTNGGKQGSLNLGISFLSGIFATYGITLILFFLYSTIGNGTSIVSVVLLVDYIPLFGIYVKSNWKHTKNKSFFFCVILFYTFYHLSDFRVFLEQSILVSTFIWYCNFNSNHIHSYTAKRKLHMKKTKESTHVF